jgi:type VI protein secretion system component VasK
VSRLSRQCGILNILQPYRPPRPVTGITLLFYVYEVCTPRETQASAACYEDTILYIELMCDFRGQ